MTTVQPLVKKIQRLPSKEHNNLVHVRGLYAVADEPPALFSFNYPNIIIMDYLEKHSNIDRRACVSPRYTSHHKPCS